MTTSQAFVPYDTSTVANYKSWAQQFGTFLTAAGWSQTADTGQVNWANVVTVPTGTPTANGWSPQGAFSTSGNYSGLAKTSVGTVTTVTSSGLTYGCFISNFLSGTWTVLQNTANALTITATSLSSNTVVYSCAAATTAMVGMLFVVTIGGSNLNANNTGTYICLAATASTSITLNNTGGSAQASVTGGSPGAQATSSTANVSVSTAGSFLGTSPAANVFAGHTITMSGWSGGLTANNTNLTVTFSALSNGNVGFVVATATLTSGTQAGVLGWDYTAPVSNTLHWCPYNYEVWQANDSQQSTNPIFLRLLYDVSDATHTACGVKFMVGTATTGTGWISGNMIALAEQVLVPATTNGQGGTLYECDFCWDAAAAGSVSFMMWRSTISVSSLLPITLVIERARDASGNSLDAYTFVYWGGATAATHGSAVIFKPGTGSSYPGGTTNAGIPTVNISDNTTNTTINGLAVASPVFPFVGYIGNPGLQGLFMRSGDCAEGGLVTVVLYASSHTYLMSKPQWAGHMLSNAGNVTCGATGIRWE